MRSKTDIENELEGKPIKGASPRGPGYKHPCQEVNPYYRYRQGNYAYQDRGNPYRPRVEGIAFGYSTANSRDDLVVIGTIQFFSTRPLSRASLGPDASNVQPENHRPEITGRRFWVYTSYVENEGTTWAVTYQAAPLPPPVGSSPPPPGSRPSPWVPPPFYWPSTARGSPPRSGAPG